MPRGLLLLQNGGRLPGVWVGLMKKMASRVWRSLRGGARFSPVAPARSLHDGGGQGAQVVGGGHAFAIGAGRADGDEVAAPAGGQGLVFDEGVAALAHGAHDVVGAAWGVGCGRGVGGQRDALHGMAGAIHGGAHQLGHAGVEDEEAARGALLDVEHSGDEGATLAHHGAAELEVELLTGAQGEVAAKGVEIALKAGDALVVGVLVADAEAAAHVDAGGADALALEALLQLVDAMAESAEGGVGEYLRADVEVEPFVADVRQAVGGADGALGVAEVDAELVFAQAGGDLRVGAGIDIGVDAEGYGGDGAEACGALVDDVQLLEALHVEAGDAVAQGEVDFAVALAHSGVDDARGGDAGSDGGFDFASAHAVGTEAGAGDASEDGGVGIGLDGIVDVPVGLTARAAVDFGQGGIEQGGVVVVVRRGVLQQLVGGEVCVHGPVGLAEELAAE